jgi:hypothetical protein
MVANATSCLRSTRQLPRIIPAAEGALRNVKVNPLAPKKSERGVEPERSFHAQCFGNFHGGGAVLAAVWSHAEIVAAGEGGTIVRSQSRFAESASAWAKFGRKLRPF